MAALVAVKIERRVVIELNEAEAKWLHGLCQNPLEREKEGTEAYEIRAAIFEATDPRKWPQS